MLGSAVQRRVAPASDTAKTVRNTVVRTAPHQVASLTMNAPNAATVAAKDHQRTRPARQSPAAASGSANARPGKPATMKPLRPHMVVIMWSSTCLTPSRP